MEQLKCWHFLLLFCSLKKEECMAIILLSSNTVECMPVYTVLKNRLEQKPQKSVDLVEVQLCLTYKSIEETKIEIFVFLQYTKMLFLRLSGTIALLYNPITQVTDEDLDSAALP